MRFATKFDRWLVVVIAIVAAFSLSTVTLGLFRQTNPAPWPVAFLVWALWLYVAASTLPQYYEVRQEGLFIRQGVRKALLPYESLVEVEVETGSRSSGVFSRERVRIITNQPRRFWIAPADQSGFLDAVARRSPHLVRRGFGLAQPFSSPEIS
jgi:Bacterial PH domain